MIRKFIPLDKLEIFDQMHQSLPDGSYIVDEARDGQSTEKHLEGTRYIKKVLEDGHKIRPILVQDNEDGTYTRLDGFKRCMAYNELDYKLIEAFVCSLEEVRRRDIIKYDGEEMWCGKGGQPKEVYSLHEGSKEDIILYWNNDIEGLRIEVAESIQIHWSRFGRYRLSLGKEEFLQLAEAITKL